MEASMLCVDSAMCSLDMLATCMWLHGLRASDSAESASAISAEPRARMRESHRLD